jgi:hypothetical protein
MLTDTQGNLVAAFGCMGGYMQPQGHLQVCLWGWCSGSHQTERAARAAPTLTRHTCFWPALHAPHLTRTSTHNHCPQVLVNLLQRGLDPQAALDAPRFCVDRLDSAVGPASVQDSYVLLVRERVCLCVCVFVWWCAAAQCRVQSLHARSAGC